MFYLVKKSLIYQVNFSRMFLELPTLFLFVRMMARGAHHLFSRRLVIFRRRLCLRAPPNACIECIPLVRHLHRTYHNRRTGNSSSRLWLRVDKSCCAHTSSCTRRTRARRRRRLPSIACTRVLCTRAHSASGTGTRSTSSYTICL